MKKVITMVLTAALALAVSGAVQASTLETKGEFRARYWSLDNYLLDKHATEFWDQRLRVYGTWNVAESVSVNFRADILEGFWGDNTQTPSYTAQIDPVTGDVQVKQTLIGTAPKAQITFDQANMAFKWPGTPVSLIIGRQDVAWGVGMAAKADNRDRFKAVVALDGITVVAAYDKFVEQFSNHDVQDANGLTADDSRDYVLGVVTSAAGFKMGLLGVYVVNEATAAVDVTRYLIDYFAMGKVGPADVSLEAAYMGGKNESNTGGADVDAQGIGVYAGAKMPAGPVTVGLEGTYVSGDKPGTTDKNEGAFKSDYHGPFWSVILFNNLDYPGYNGESSTSADTGVSNAIAGKLSVAAAPAKNLSVYGAVVYATRDKVADGVDKPLGTEIDLVASYAITDAVSLTLGGGYLMAGDYFGDVDDPWGAMAAFKVNF